MILNWKISREDHDLIVAIACRAANIMDDPELMRDVLMDLTACHANGTPLRLADLLSADQFNFTHDVFGINAYLDRNTGNLTGCFVPRFIAIKETK